jgi:hypothetical protein
MAQKVPLSRRALKQRIQRYLSRDNEKLKYVGGKYVVVSLEKQGMTDTLPDLEQYARNKGILAPFEALTD